MSETFETLHNLVHKGVKVVMDIPYELWNETSAEVADLKKQVGAPPPGFGGGRSSVDEGHWEPGDCGQAISPCLWLQPPRRVTATSPVGGETRLRLSRLFRAGSGPGFANVRPCG